MYLWIAAILAVIVIAAILAIVLSVNRGDKEEPSPPSVPNSAQVYKYSAGERWLQSRGNCKKGKIIKRDSSPKCECTSSQCTHGPSHKCECDQGTSSQCTHGPSHKCDCDQGTSSQCDQGTSSQCDQGASSQCDQGTSSQCDHSSIAHCECKSQCDCHSGLYPNDCNKYGADYLISREFDLDRPNYAKVFGLGEEIHRDDNDQEGLW